MVQINDIVKRQKHSKKTYEVIGFDYPLPHVGGGSKGYCKRNWEKNTICQGEYISLV